MRIILPAILTLIFVFNSFSSAPVPTFRFIKPENREITGTVADKNNKFIEGLWVKVINTATKRQYKTKINESGFFRFTDLPLGNYIIKFEGKRAFSPKTIENIEVGLNGGVIYNISLEAK